ncbi:MAG: FG-GAP and VCBS repeat-containing protein [bacterium]
MKFFISILLGSIVFLSPIYPLELHNLELLLEISDPDTTLGGFGERLSSGDINGDGIKDIVVGRHSNIPGKHGLVFVFYGGNTIDSIPDVTLVGDIFRGYGLFIGVGDVNGDGYDDIITTAGEGCNVYFGGNPMDSLPDLSMEAGLYAGAGDLNGDGYDDWIIGQYQANGNAGLVRIYFGSLVPDSVPDIILNGEPASNFGAYLESGYNVNNDGYDDLFVSAMAYSDTVATWRGKTYIYYGGNPMDTIPDVEMIGPPRTQDFFGDVIALVPDLNNDGFDEAVVGEPLNAVRDTVFVYWGGNPMDSTIDMVFADSGLYFGNAVCGSRKIHPAGGKALIVGAPMYPAYLPRGRALRIYDGFSNGYDL